MKKTNKKGFTIVELVIVIAIVAILAAVLIPTFSSIINKANQSSDIQAVRQMNMALAAESVENTPSNIEAVIKILAAAGYNAEDKLIPVSTGHSFYWYKTYNLIVLVKGANELIYPKDNEAVVSSIVGDIAKPEEEKVLYNLREGRAALPITPTGKPIEGGSTSDEGNDIIPSFREGGDYILKGDITITQPISIDKKLTIYLDGHNIFLAPEDGVSDNLLSILAEMNIVGSGTICSQASYPNHLIVQSDGKLNLKNTDLTLNGDVGIQNDGGKVHIYGGEFTVNGNYNIMLYNCSGEMTVNGTTFKEADNAPISYLFGAPIYNAAELKMKGVTIFSSNFCTSTDGGTLTIDEYSNLELKGLKTPAPCTEYYAYNYDCDSERPTNNTFEVEYEEETITVFKYDGSADYIPQEDKTETITLTEDTAWDYHKYFAKTLTIDLKGNILTLDNCFFSGGDLIITDSKGGGTIDLVGSWSIYYYFEHVDSVTISTDKETYINITEPGSGLSPDAIVQMVASGKMYHFTNVSCGFNNCTFTNRALSIKNGYTIVFGNDVTTFSNSISINSTINLDLSGNKLELSSNTITVQSGSTLNITGGTEGTEGTITETNGNQPFIVKDGGTLNLTDVTVEGGESLFSITNSGMATLNNVTLPTVALVEIINNERISATNVSLDSKYDLNKTSASITLELNETLDLPGDITVLANSTNSTMEIILNNQTLKTTGSSEITVGNGCTLKISGGILAPAVVSLNGGKVEFTDVTIPPAVTAAFYSLLQNIMQSPESTLSNVTYGTSNYLKVDKIAGSNATNITLEGTTGIGAALVVPTGCELTINLNNKQLKIDNTIEVNGTLNITIASTGGGGNIQGSSKITVKSVGVLSIEANQFKDNGNNELNSDDKNNSAAKFKTNYVIEEDGATVTVEHKTNS